MKALQTGTALAAVAAAILAFAPAALATEFVPPENAAATQYTESFPTAGGNHDATSGGVGNGHRSPTEALGTDNAHRLQQKGKDGQAAAELAAATAPAESVTTRSTESSNPPEQEPAKQGEPAAAGESPSVNSGSNEVIGQATGASGSNNIGWLLPLVIGSAAAWSLLFFWRRRRRTA
jgi:opacity protein-like surface antigen